MELLTYEDVAKMFGVKVNTIKSWLARKQIPKSVIFKIGAKKGTVRFVKSKLEQWINDGCLQA